MRSIANSFVRGIGWSLAALLQRPERTEVGRAESVYGGDETVRQSGVSNSYVPDIAPSSARAASYVSQKHHASGNENNISLMSPNLHASQDGPGDIPGFRSLDVSPRSIELLTRTGTDRPPPGHIENHDDERGSIRRVFENIRRKLLVRSYS